MEERTPCGTSIERSDFLVGFEFHVYIDNTDLKKQNDTIQQSKSELLLFN